MTRSRVENGVFIVRFFFRPKWRNQTMQMTWLVLESIKQIGRGCQDWCDAYKSSVIPFNVWPVVSSAQVRGFRCQWWIKACCKLVQLIDLPGRKCFICVELVPKPCLCSQRAYWMEVCSPFQSETFVAVVALTGVIKSAFLVNVPSQYREPGSSISQILIIKENNI